MIGTGNLTPEDLVWKEGLEDWKPAGEVPGLFDQAAAATPPATPGSPLQRAKSKRPKPAKPAAVPASPAAEAKPRLSGMRFNVKRPVEIFRFAAFLGQPLLLVGLLLILMSRGCDRLGERHVARAQAQAKLAESDFQDEWDRQKLSVEQELADLQAKSEPTPAERSRRELLAEQLRSLNEAKQAELNRLRAGKLRELSTASRDAKLLKPWQLLRKEFSGWAPACSRWPC